LHGLFASDGFRRAYLAELGAQPHEMNYEHEADATLDALADHLERCFDTEALLTLAAKRT